MRFAHTTEVDQSLHRLYFQQEGIGRYLIDAVARFPSGFTFDDLYDATNRALAAATQRYKGDPCAPRIPSLEVRDISSLLDHLVAVPGLLTKVNGIKPHYRPTDKLLEQQRSLAREFQSLGWR